MNRGEFTPIATRRPPVLTRPRPARRNIPSPWVAALQLLLTLVALWGAFQLVVWGLKSSVPRDVTIPKDLIGMELPAAQQLLRQAGIESEVIVSKTSDKAAANTVIDSDPQAGRTVKVGRKIGLTISLGSEWTNVPDVKGMSVEQAKRLITSRSLAPGQEVGAFSDKVPTGFVVNQSPKPGERKRRNTPVALQVSKGKKPAEVVTQEESPGQEKSQQVIVSVPPGAELQEVKIVVDDDDGEHIVLDDYYHPGDTVTKTATGKGQVSIKVYISGELVKQQDL